MSCLQVLTLLNSDVQETGVQWLEMDEKGILNAQTPIRTIMGH